LSPARDQRPVTTEPGGPGNGGGLTCLSTLRLIPMLRLVMIYLFQWFKRLASNAVSRNGRDDTYTENFSSREDSDSGRWTFVSLFIVFTLSLYSLAGLGYYAKVHVWDSFTEEQKANIAQAMIVSSQNL
jgi:hypothetical protein